MKLNFTRITFCILSAFTAITAKAQQDPHYSWFMENKVLYNPGFAGATNGKICVTLLNRTQWVGFGGKTVDGLPQGDAPSNLVMHINTSIGRQERFGIAGTIVKDQLGFQTTTIPRLALSFRQPLGDDANLAFGAGVGYMQRSLDGEKYHANEPNDPKIPTQKVSAGAVDLDFGLYFIKQNLFGIDNFYTGISSTHLNQNKITYEWGQNSLTVNSKMHYYFVAGGDLPLGGMILQPNVIVKKDPAKIQTDLNCFLQMNSNLRGGLTWRPMDAVVLMGSYTFPDILKGNLMVGYSYDLTTSKIIKYSTGSHEIFLRYCFGITRTPPPVRSVIGPRFL